MGRRRWSEAYPAGAASTASSRTWRRCGAVANLPANRGPARPGPATERGVQRRVEDLRPDAGRHFRSNGSLQLEGSDPLRDVGHRTAVSSLRRPPACLIDPEDPHSSTRAISSGQMPSLGVPAEARLAAPAQNSGFHLAPGSRRSMKRKSQRGEPAAMVSVRTSVSPRFWASSRSCAQTTCRQNSDSPRSRM